MTKTKRYGLTVVLLAIFLIAFGTITVACGIVEIFAVDIPSYALSACSAGVSSLSCVITLLVNSFYIEKGIKYYAYGIAKKEKVTMSGLFNELVGKDVLIKTISDCVEGKVIEIEENFIIIENKTKKGDKKIYVNVNTVDTITKN